MLTMSKALGKLIREAREARGLTQGELAQRAGVTGSAVNQWESGKNIPGQKKQPRLCQILGLDPNVVRQLAIEEELKGVPAQASFIPSQAETPPTISAPPAVTGNLRDIPVWASVAAGDGDGEMILTSEPIDYIRRSERTANVPNPWAFHIVGDSMLERLAQGDQVIINPAMPLLPMTDCVFIHNAPDGMMYGLVKRLLRATGDAWRVRQLNPVKDFDLPRRKWSKAYRIAEIRPRL